MRRILAAALLALCGTGVAGAQSSGPTGELTPAQLKAKVEAQVRKLYALGPSWTVKAAEPANAPISGMVKVEVEVGLEGQSDTVTFYATRDGRYVIRGEVFDTTVDPFAATRAQLKIAGSPFKGPANARVTVVEFSDFQCPTCRALHQTLRAIVPLYPNVKFVFKDFPLAQIHPWAMTAHSAAYCARQQNPDSFWKFHDLIFDKQDVISPTTAWNQMLDFGTQLGLDVAALRTCMAAPETRAALEASVQEGIALKVANTPTVFVNGRRLVGGDRQTLEQFIQYELAATAPKQSRAPT
jgi:protein-disulfide isomerase